ncbi:hypothetical protein L4P27_006098 [Pseudomonas aeruginosa]|nr:hypothetical protein [Pseudomonas aeruginosa]EKV3012272.1 hypothetical protein [Pseudomonas aeruginosa]
MTISHQIFQANDTVVSSGTPFWMTVRSVNPSTGRCSCYFGASNNYAGSFSQNELEFYGGTELLGVANAAVLLEQRA